MKETNGGRREQYCGRKRKKIKGGNWSEERIVKKTKKEGRGKIKY